MVIINRKKLHIEVGTGRVKVGPFWVPDGLHVWIGNRGMHAFWNKGETHNHIDFERA